MRLLAIYLISKAYSPHFTVTSNANVLLVTAFAAITALAENVSSEISNYIEYDSPAKENIGVDSQSKQLVEKSEIATSSIKYNDSSSTSDSETSRRARYLRGMPPSMGAAAMATYGFERRSSAAAAAAAAAAADEDLRKYGRILKYHAVPLDGRKYPAAPTQPHLSRRPYAKPRYRPYSKDKFRTPASVSPNHFKHKWPLQSPNDAFSPYRGYSGEDHDINYNDNEEDEGGADAGAGGDYAAFSSDEPYEDYYEDDQSQLMENGHNGDHKKKNTVGWFLKNYRDKFEKEREPAAVSYEDVEPALSLEHAVGKRIPFTKYGGDGGRVNVESYAPYKKQKFPRGRGEPNSEPMEWNSHVGEKQAYAAATLSKYRRLQRPQSSWPVHSSYNQYKSAAAKYSPFEDDNSHRFKLDNSPRFGAAASAIMSDAQNNEIEKRERENALKAHLYRRRNKLGDRGRFWPSPSPSASPLSFNEDELTADVGNDQENAVSITQPKRLPPSPPVQEDDVVVYSSRYRNKQAAVAAAQRVLDTRNDENYDSAASGTNPIDFSRLSADYHNRHRSRSPESAAASTKQRKKFATFDRTRKSNGYAPESDVETYDAPAPSETDDDLATNESFWPQPLQKSNHAVSSYAASLSSSSTPSSVSISRPASFSYSYNKKSANRRTPSTTTTAVTENTAAAAAQKTSLTTTPVTVTESYADPDFDFDSAVSASDSDSNRNGNGARFEINSENGADRISASELIAYMSASSSEPVVHKQDRFANANEAFVLGGYDGGGGFGYGYGYPFVRTFSEQHEKLASNYHKSPQPSSGGNDQDFEINLDQYSYRRKKKRRRR